MNPSKTVGTRRDPLGISAWRNIAHRIVISSRVPVHSALVQKSVATNTNLAGRLSVFDAREFRADSQGVTPKKMAGRLLKENQKAEDFCVGTSRLVPAISPGNRCSQVACCWKLVACFFELTIPLATSSSLPVLHPACARGGWRALRNQWNHLRVGVWRCGTRRQY
jgi:hypothetical protein